MKMKMKKIISLCIAAMMLVGTFPISSAVSETAEGAAKLTVYTEEMRKNALENIEKYEWARELRDKAVNAYSAFIYDRNSLFTLGDNVCLSVLQNEHTENSRSIFVEGRCNKPSVEGAVSGMRAAFSVKRFRELL